MYKIDQLAQKKNVEFRFGVRDDSGRVSHVFKLWSRKSATKIVEDIYISPRTHGNLSKASLHSSGARQLGFVSDTLLLTQAPHAPSRHLHKWTPAEAGSNGGFSVEFCIDVPSEHLTNPNSFSDGKNIRWIDAPPVGESVNIKVVTSDPPGPFNFPDEPLFSAHLSDGRYLFVVHQFGPSFSIVLSREEKDEFLRQMLGYDGVSDDASRSLISATMLPDAVGGWIDLSSKKARSLLI